MQRAWLVVLAVGCGSSARAPELSRLNAPPPPVVEPPSFDPPRPTLRLPRHFAPTRYTARLAIDPAKPTFEGEIEIDGNLDRRSSVIWLHGKQFDIASATASDGKRAVALAAKLQGELLELRPAQPLDVGHWTLKITYRGKIQDQSPAGAYVGKYGDDPYVITQFEAIAARLVFPCIDEPDRKTPWQLTLDVPKGQVAVANTAPTGTVALDATHVRIAFAETRPLPSYLVAFAVGPFEVLPAGNSKSGTPLRVVTPRGTTKKVEFLVESLPKIVDSLEAWFGMPYPYPKLDIVVAPLEPSAMENPGLITTAPKYVMFDHPGPREKYACVTTIGHETAHQWFGDLVTAAWWDDIWLNESFATWMEDKVLAAFDPSWPLEGFSYRMAGFAADELLSSRKIRQPIEAQGDISNAFDGVTYPKGGTILRMLEHVLGPEKFRTAIQHYLTAHADGNATSADLFDALGGGKLVTGWFDQPGVPEVSMKLACDGGKARIALAQKRYLPTPSSSPEQWTIPICVTFPGGKQCTTLDAAEGELALPSCPAWFAPEGDYGYYHAKLEARAVEAIRDRGWKSLTTAEHLAIYADTYAFALQGTLPFALWGSLTAKLGASSDSRELQAALGDTFVFGGGTPGIPHDLLQALPKELLPAARAKARAIAEPLIKKIGLLPQPNDTVQIANLRSDLLGVINWTRSHVLDAQAKKLVAKYHELTIDTMTAVLDLAANADPKIAAQLHLDLAKEVDPVVHQTLVAVLSGLRDPEQHRAMIAALFADPTVGKDELAQIWYSFTDEDARADLEAFVRAHLDEVEKRMPTTENEIFPLGALPGYTLAAACDSSRRDEITAYVNEHFASLPAAGRPMKQALEELDHCIARKKLLEPSLRVWLTGKP